MIEIIPNWHPIFVHFTIALFSTSVGFFVFAYIVARLNIQHDAWAREFETVARWCLWLVSVMTIITVCAGLYAYSTVNHDAPSHLAMTIHRAWALPTAMAIFLMGCWAAWRYAKNQRITITFVLFLLIVQGLLLSTAWHGAELVYRYGLGVMSLPQAEGKGHHHQEAITGNQPTSSEAIQPHSHGQK